MDSEDETEEKLPDRSLALPITIDEKCMSH